jgi:hypothetical protein
MDYVADGLKFAYRSLGTMASAGGAARASQIGLIFASFFRDYLDELVPFLPQFNLRDAGILAGRGLGGEGQGGDFWLAFGLRLDASGPAGRRLGRLVDF